jgi:hypothetical protein
MMNLNFRVFRRNGKNLILLWSQSQLSDEQKTNISAFIVDDGSMAEGKELVWSNFKPDNPEKFAQDVGGIVIPHTPARPCTIRVVIGYGDESLEMVKEVLPANSVGEIPKPQASDAARKFHMYAMDFSTNQWVPWPADGVIPGNVQILVKE